MICESSLSQLWILTQLGGHFQLKNRVHEIVCNAGQCIEAPLANDDKSYDYTVQDIWTL